jgi:hypothetical protein
MDTETEIQQYLKSMSFLTAPTTSNQQQLMKDDGLTRVFFKSESLTVHFQNSILQLKNHLNNCRFVTKFICLYDILDAKSHTLEVLVMSHYTDEFCKHLEGTGLGKVIHNIKIGQSLPSDKGKEPSTSELVMHFWIDHLAKQHEKLKKGIHKKKISDFSNATASQAFTKEHYEKYLLTIKHLKKSTNFKAPKETNVQTAPRSTARPTPKHSRTSLTSIEPPVIIQKKKPVDATKQLPTINCILMKFPLPSKPNVSSLLEPLQPATTSTTKPPMSKSKTTSTALYSTIVKQNCVATKTKMMTQLADLVRSMPRLQPQSKIHPTSKTTPTQFLNSISLGNGRPKRNQPTSHKSDAAKTYQPTTNSNIIHL